MEDDDDMSDSNSSDDGNLLNVNNNDNLRITKKDFEKKPTETKNNEKKEKQQTQTKNNEKKEKQKNIINYENIYTLGGHKSDIQDIAWSNDSKLLASCGLDRKVIIWDLSIAQPSYVCMCMYVYVCVCVCVLMCPLCEVFALSVHKWKKHMQIAVNKLT